MTTVVVDFARTGLAVTVIIVVLVLVKDSVDVSEAEVWGKAVVVEVVM